MPGEAGARAAGANVAIVALVIVRRSRHILAAFVFLKCAREQTLQTEEIGPTRVAAIPQRIRARSSPPFLLQRLWVGKIFRRFLVQQRNQLLRCGRSLDLPVANNIFGAEFLAVELFVGAAVGAQCGTFERDSGEQPLRP